MLKVQEYLKSGKTLEDLKNELGIEVKLHDSLPLVILNYSQTNSPKTNPIVKECRGLVLETETWNLVAKAFDRFFNYGEDLENSKSFNWNNFSTTSKIDGSLIIVYNYKGQWMINSRGSFGDAQCGQSGKTWREFVEPFLKDAFEAMNPELTYVFEFVSMWNKVVTRYHKEDLYHLAVFHQETEILQHSRDAADCFKVNAPERYHFKSISEIENFLQEKEKNDPTFEGVVVVDKNGMRLKIKNKAYLALHRLYQNDSPSPKNLLPFVLAGEASELLTYFPEYKEEYDKVENRVNSEYSNLVLVWEKYWRIESQKDFAIAILPETKFSSILFRLRKEYGKNQTVDLLDKEWRKSETVILKILYDR